MSSSIEQKARFVPLFTSSWDDGHPLDIRVADVLARHGFGATFFVPSSNRELLPVMTAAQLRALQAGGFEIGSHTLNHCYLTTIDDAAARCQIVQGKRELEQALGQPVLGFCYPGGKYNKRHVEMVNTAGFRYARHMSNLYADLKPEPFAMPVTLQFYPHPRSVYLRNFVRHSGWRRRTRMLITALSHDDLLSRLQRALEVACEQNGVFHLWGHSYELNNFNGWAVLDDFLRYAAECIPAENRLANVDALCRRDVLK
jgi:peptidoglycan/xylan/chitin deacetylase (PgdA/CDA1 family)